jgi:transcriptional regulator with XRE-family HTH domain
VNGEQLKANLNDFGWSQAELAKRLKVHPNTVTKWVNDRKPVPQSVILWVNALSELRALHARVFACN